MRSAGCVAPLGLGIRSLVPGAALVPRLPRAGLFQAFGLPECRNSSVRCSEQGSGVSLRAFPVIDLIDGIGAGNGNSIGGQKQKAITRKASVGIPVNCERQNLAIPGGLENVSHLVIVSVAHSHGI